MSLDDYTQSHEVGADEDEREAPNTKRTWTIILFLGLVLVGLLARSCLAIDNNDKEPIASPVPAVTISVTPSEEVKESTTPSASPKPTKAPNSKAPVAKPSPSATKTEESKKCKDVAFTRPKWEDEEHKAKNAARALVQQNKSWGVYDLYSSELEWLANPENGPLAKNGAHRAGRDYASIFWNSAKLTKLLSDLKKIKENGGACADVATVDLKYFEGLPDMYEEWNTAIVNMDEKSMTRVDATLNGVTAHYLELRNSALAG